MSTYERKSKYRQEYENDMTKDCTKLNINDYTSTKLYSIKLKKW